MANTKVLEQDRLLPGAILGSYRIVELIGEGGMGCVYHAEHVTLGRKWRSGPSTGSLAPTRSSSVASSPRHARPLSFGVEECDDGNTVDGDWCSASCALECPYGGSIWSGNGHCYFPLLSWPAFDAADDVCGRIGGSYRVTITSAAENTFVAAIVATMEDPAWLGFSDEGAEGVWAWIDTGEAPVYTHWLTGEPNNGGIGEPQNCAIMHNREVGWWLDVNCGAHYQVLCEHDYGYPGRMGTGAVDPGHTGG